MRINYLLYMWALTVSVLNSEARKFAVKFRGIIIRSAVLWVFILCRP